MFVRLPKIALPGDVRSLFPKRFLHISTYGSIHLQPSPRLLFNSTLAAPEAFVTFLAQ